jgi:integrase
MTRSKKPRATTGIITRPDGTHQVHYMIRGVRTWSPRFPADTPRSTLLKWREDALAAAKKRAPAVVVPSAGSVAADIVEYGRLRAAVPTMPKILRLLDKWAAALGRDRGRNSITKEEIERQLQQWQLAGMAPATARKLIFHLQAFYRRMNGDDGANPARLAVRPPEPKYDQPRAIPYDVIPTILDQLCPTRQARGGAVPSLAPYRLKVIAYTGLPPGVVAKLRRTHVRDLHRHRLHLPPRLKGSGVEARTIELTDQGVEALRAFIRAGAWGPFKDAAVNKAFKSAAVHVGLTDEQGRATVHCYDLRHSFGTMLYQVTRDLDTVGRFLGHAKGSRATARYALGANADVDRDAARRASAHLAAHQTAVA